MKLLMSGWNASPRELSSWWMAKISGTVWVLCVLAKWVAGRELGSISLSMLYSSISLSMLYWKEVRFFTFSFCRVGGFVFLVPIFEFL